MALETETDVGQIQKVQDDQGNRQSPANQREQQRTNERLGNFGALETATATDDGTTTTFPSNEVPNGVELMMQADPSNSSPVDVGDVVLPAGSSIGVRVTNTDAISFTARTNGDRVNLAWES